MTSVLLFSLAIALQTPPPQTTPTPTPRPPAQVSAAQGAATSTRPGALVLTVTNEKGEFLAGATVAAHGAVDRGGATGADGVVTLQNMPVGTYRCRITRDGFVMLDKEVAIRGGARTVSEAVLSAAPPPPPAPTPPPSKPAEPKPVPPAGTAGTPRVLSIADLADQMLRDSQPTVERQLGCSGVTSSRLIATRENIALHRNTDVDEVLYLLAGDATLTVAEKEQVVGAGWFGLVPRGTSYSLVRRGRSPVVVLSVQSGQPCGGGL